VADEYGDELPKNPLEEARDFLFDICSHTEHIEAIVRDLDAAAEEASHQQKAILDVLNDIKRGISILTVVAIVAAAAAFLR
jgi:hypothetical protein